MTSAEALKQIDEDVARVSVCIEMCWDWLEKMDCDRSQEKRDLDALARLVAWAKKGASRD